MLKKIAFGVAILLTYPAMALCFDIPETRVEVEEFFDSYVEAFATRNSNLVAEKYFLAPMYLRTGDRVQLLQSKEIVIEHLDSVFSTLSDKNYSRTEIVAKNICVLTGDTAIASVVLRRFNSEGLVILESGASYSIAKIGGSWRFPMASVHSSEMVVTCEA